MITFISYFLPSGKVIENVESSLGVPKPEDIKSDTTVDEGAKTDDKEEETKQG